MGELASGDPFDLVKLIVGVPFGIIMMIRGISRIQELFLFFVFLIPLEIMLPTRILPIPGLTVSNILLIELLILLYSKKKRNNERFFFSTSLGRPFLFIVVFNASLLLWGIVEFSSEPDYLFIDCFVYYKRTILVPIFICIASVNIFQKREDARKVIVIIVIGILLVGLQAVMEHATGDSRIEGLMGYKNAEGAFFAMYFPLLLSILFGGIGKKLKIMTYAAIVLSCYGLVFTLSRGAMISLAFAAMFLGIFKYRWLLLPLSISCLILLFAVPMVISERFNRTYEGPKASEGQFDGNVVNFYEYEKMAETIDSSSFKRILIWEGALRAISENPLFGIGYNRWPYVGREYTGVLSLTSTHNSFLEIMVNSGVTGLLLFLWVIYYAIKNALKLARQCNDKLYVAIGWGFMGCLIAFISINMFGSHMYRYCLIGYFWILIGMVMRLSIMTDEEEKDKTYVKN